MSRQLLGKRSYSSTLSQMADDRNVHSTMVHHVLVRAGLASERDNDTQHQENLKTTTTKAGWCLRQGLLHLSQQDAALALRIEQHGVPSFYQCCAKSRTSACRHEATQEFKDPTTCFESLCRIIVGQFISGKAARAAWRRLVDHVLTSNHHELTHGLVLQCTGNDGSKLQTFRTAIGLTNNKAKSIYDLALHFNDGRLSEEFLSLQPSSATPGNPSESTEQIRQALLKVRGIGAWSFDMFMLFTLEHADILPLGDLGVRKGIAKHFFTSPNKSNKNKKEVLLDAKKDSARIHERLDKFRPYRSLVSYYMWRVADTPDAMSADDVGKDPGKVITDTTTDESLIDTPATPPPPKRQRRKSIKRIVTP